VDQGESLSIDRVRLLVEGFDDLRSGAKYTIFGMVLWVIGLILIAIALLGGADDASGIVMSILVLIVGILVGLYGTVKWMHGGKRFRGFNEDLKYGELGPKYMLYSIPILILALLLIGVGIMGESIILVIMGYILMAASGIIALIGYILFGIFLLKLDDLKVDNIRLPDFNIDAILWLIGLVLGVTSIVAIILIYMHSNTAIERITSSREYGMVFRVG